jgi:hypothetical protein
MDHFDNGFRFGVGFAFGDDFDRDMRGDFHNRRFGRRAIWPGTIGILDRVEEPPYFAKFPPVYYSHIVPRPYGISPYAAPPGIAPAEMFVPQPAKIDNPYFLEESAPVVPEGQPSPSDEAKPADNAAPPEPGGNNEVTWLKNPYIDHLATNQ